MLKLTDTAKTQLDEFFTGKEVASIRVYLGEGGCSGAMLNLAMDNGNDQDEVIQAQGYTFVVAKELLKVTGEIIVDAGPYGFSVQSENPVSEGGGCSCTSGCSCGC